MTYADIMAKKRAEQQKQAEEKSAPPPLPPQATQSTSPIPQQPAVDGNQSDNNQDYQNTSDDAESIPISYQVKKLICLISIKSLIKHRSLRIRPNKSNLPRKLKSQKTLTIARFQKYIKI